MKVPVLLFAAGLGTRMGAMVNDRPKPLIPVAGRPLIDHALHQLDTPRIGRKVVNVHYRADMIRDHLRDRDIRFSDETARLMETGGGLRCALPLLNQTPAITMNTDAVWRGPNPVDAVLDAWRDDMEALLLIVPKERVSGHPGAGDFRLDAAGRLHRAPEAIYTGLQMIRTDTLADMADEPFSMNVIWDQMAARGGLFGVTFVGQWCDVGQPSSIPLAEAMLDV